VGLILLFALTPFWPSPGRFAPVAAPTPAPAAASPATAPAASSAAGGDQVAKGKELATRFGCVACHSADGSASVGPTWKGLAGSQRPLENGQTVTADDAYLMESIREPDAKVVKGFPKGVMAPSIAAYKDDLSKQENLDALVAYIKSLR
jgi:cytochrome c551/c552